MACVLGIEQDCNECRMCGNGKGGKKMTNADRIRELTNEELAVFLYCVSSFETEEQARYFQKYHVNTNDPSNKLYNSFREWLESECDAE